MNLKNCLCALLVGATAVGAYAVPAKHGLRTLRQPDGSTVQVRLMGDESSHFYTTPEGQTLKRNAQGMLVPAAESEIAAMKASAKDRRAARRLPIRRVAADANESQVPHIGSPKIPVLLVQYSDYKFKDADPLATFNNFFATGATSAYQYFADQSNGKFTPQFDVYGPYTLPNKRSYYGGNDSDGYDLRVGTMVGQACNGLNYQIDYSQYDNDGDGECDVVIVLYAGDGEASSYDDDAENAVWPCQWELSSSDYGKYLRLDQTKVDLFAVFNELNGSNLKKIDGIGTFCHEFSHCLGLPDFYDTQYGPHFGMANWSLMDYGSYNDDGYTPIGYSAYEKEFMGWIEIPEAVENTHYSLTAMNQKSLDTDMAVRVTNNSDKNEYYILENRAKQGWDKFMPAEGMMITHVTYSADAWQGNYVNDYDLQRMTIIPADNNLKLDTEKYYGETYYYINEASLLGDLWPQSYAAELTDSSTPAAKVNTGKYMSKPITEIAANTDGTVSFWFMKAPKEAVAAPSNLRHTQTASDTALIEWDCTDENVGSYTLEVAEYLEKTYTLLDDVDFTNCNWTGSGYTTVEDGGLKFGSNKQQGVRTSGNYTADADFDIVTICFNAKSYGSDDSSVKVSLLDTSSTTIAGCTSTVELTTSAQDYTLTFPIEEGRQFKVRFETTAAKKRFYLYTAQIYSGEPDADADKVVKRAAAKQTYTDITEKSYAVSGLVPGAKYTYRVMSHPLDTETYDKSAWSEKGLLELAVLSGVVVVEETAAETVWYTIDGIRLSGAPEAAGVYIRVAGGKAEKVAITTH